VEPSGGTLFLSLPWAFSVWRKSSLRPASGHKPLPVGSPPGLSPGSGQVTAVDSPLSLASVCPPTPLMPRLQRRTGPLRPLGASSPQRTLPPSPLPNSSGYPLPAALRRVRESLFPPPPASDTIPTAHGPSLCVRHAQAERFTSTRSSWGPTSTAVGRFCRALAGEEPISSAV